MRIIRYIKDDGNRHLAALTDDNNVYDLPNKDFISLIEETKKREKTPIEYIKEIINLSLPSGNINELKLTTPIDAPEVWASGVTYQKSREARNYEATNGKLDSQTFYDKVYEAKRPEIFFKSTAARTVGPDQDVYLRSDSNWQIPEPELGLVIDRDGKVLGYVPGNDMSCRDIEGENPLYLPQAKIWKHSCAIGPAILLADAVEDPYSLSIICRIFRNDEKVFEGSASVSQLKRTLDELVSYLLKENEIFDGTVLLTGTCVVPPNEFTLQDEDYIEIEIPEIGVLKNRAKHQLAKTETSK